MKRRNMTVDDDDDSRLLPISHCLEIQADYRQ